MMIFRLLMLLLIATTTCIILWITPMMAHFHPRCSNPALRGISRVAVWNPEGTKQVPWKGVVSNGWFDLALLPILYMVEPSCWPMLRPPSLGPPLVPLKWKINYIYIYTVYIYIYICICTHTYSSTASVLFWLGAQVSSAAAGSTSSWPAHWRGYVHIYIYIHI